eukprot:SAG31_NODE_6277_length_2092_cov_1.167587_1_plen_31_part_10
MYDHNDDYTGPRKADRRQNHTNQARSAHTLS